MTIELCTKTGTLYLQRNEDDFGTIPRSSLPSSLLREIMHNPYVAYAVTFLTTILNQFS